MRKPTPASFGSSRNSYDSKNAERRRVRAAASSHKQQEHDGTNHFTLAKDYTKVVNIFEMIYYASGGCTHTEVSILVVCLLSSLPGVSHIPRWHACQPHCSPLLHFVALASVCAKYGYSSGRTVHGNSREGAKRGPHCASRSSRCEVWSPDAFPTRVLWVYGP